MKICLYTQVTQLLPVKKTLSEKINNLVIRDQKHEMYRTLPIDTILKSLKNSGLDGLELISPPICTDEDIEKIKIIISKHKLNVYSIHQSNDNSFNITIPEIEKLCVIAGKFSAKRITLHIDTLKEKIFDYDFTEALKKLQEKYNVKFGIENMPKSPFTLGKPHNYKGDLFSSVIKKAGLSITLDTTHLGQVNENICDFYLENKEKIINIHLGDYRKSWLNQTLLLASQTHLPLGKGELEIAKFLKLLKDDNYQGLITMEISANLDGLCESARLINSLAR